MTAIADLPDIRPSLLLDFANSGRVDPRIQCTRASSATCYGPDGKLRTVAANVPRIDYDPVTGKCLGLLVEEGRTNLYTNSAILGNHGDMAYASRVLAAGIAPDGTNTAVKLQEDATASAAHRARWWAMSNTISASKTYAFSFRAKAAGRHNIDVNGTAFLSLSFNLNTGVVSGVDASSAKMTPLPDGWWLCSFIYSTGASIAPGDPYFDLRLNNGASQTYTGDGVSGVLLWGMQVEEGTFPTSYIPTGGSAVTRAADLFDIYYTLPTVGAITSSVSGVSNANSANAYIWNAINPTDSNADHAYLFFQGGSQTTNWWVRKGNVDQSGGNVPGRYPSAGLSYDARAKTAAIASGPLLSQGTSTRPRDFPSNLSRLLLGRGRSNSGFLNGCISRLALYSGKITNAQLQRIAA